MTDQYASNDEHPLDYYLPSYMNIVQALTDTGFDESYARDIAQICLMCEAIREVGDKIENIGADIVSALDGVIAAMPDGCNV